MQCPYCGTELRCEDYYGRGILGRSDFKKLGDIYKCQNSFGFNNEEEAEEYAEKNYIEHEDWQDIVCASESFNGNFYTDERGTLHEGYPC